MTRNRPYRVDERRRLSALELAVQLHSAGGALAGGPDTEAVLKTADNFERHITHGRPPSAGEWAAEARAAKQCDGWTAIYCADCGVSCTGCLTVEPDDRGPLELADPNDPQTIDDECDLHGATSNHALDERMARFAEDRT